MAKMRYREKNRILARTLCVRARAAGVYDMQPLKPGMPSQLSTLQDQLGKANAFSGNTLKKIVDALLVLIEQNLKTCAA
jgi:hypothetical protein